MDIDFDKGVVHVRRTATPYGENGPKSAAGNRTIPLDPETIKVLKKHRKVMMEETLRCGGTWSEDSLVFPTRTGKRLSSQSRRDVFDRAITATGVKRIVFHGLRHTYATTLLRRGVYINKVSKLLGHAGVATTLNTYAHVLPEDDDHVIAAISQAFMEK